MEFILIIIKKIINKKRWRKVNKHNNTFYRNIFDFNCVEVGKGTYGPIDVQMSRHDVKLKIGNYCSIGGNVVFILSSDHPTNQISTYPFSTIVLGNTRDAISNGDIIVDDDVWIGYGVTIMSGVHIGQGAVIAAGAVVTKNVPPYAIVCGVPAKVIKYRFEENLRKELEKIDFSQLDKELIEQHIDMLHEKIESIEQFRWMPRK